MSTATAIGPTGPRFHQPRGGGARLTRTLRDRRRRGNRDSNVRDDRCAAFGLAGFQPGSSGDDAATVTSNEERAAIAELEAKARSQKPAEIRSVPLPPPSPTLTTQAPAVPLPARPPSRLAELREEEYVKALSAPPMVEAFHHGETLEVPSVASQAGTTRPYDLTITPSGQSNGTSAIASVKPAESPYLITAGSVIPAVLISGINSELPGPILAQVRENVFDSASGRWVLIPQGARSSAVPDQRWYGQSAPRSNGSG